LCTAAPHWSLFLPHASSIEESILSIIIVFFNNQMKLMTDGTSESKQQKSRKRNTNNKIYGFPTTVIGQCGS